MTTPPDIKSKRPLSPHLQVYKPQMTSMTSILHRMTGIGLAIGLVFFTWWLVAAAIGPEEYYYFVDFIASPIGLLLMFGWSVAFYYHFANGIRHLFWDSGLLFKIENAYAAGYFVFFVTALLTGATWYCVFEWGGLSL